MRAGLAILLAALACSSQSEKAGPGATPNPTPSDQTPAPSPSGGGADCESDADCATTTYTPEPVKDASGCCAALACARVETAKRAKELADAWTGACAAVRCRAPDCPAGSPDPVAACRDGRCTPH